MSLEQNNDTRGNSKGTDQNVGKKLDGQDPSDASAGLAGWPEVDRGVREVGPVLRHRPLTEELQQIEANFRFSPVDAQTV